MGSTSGELLNAQAAANLLRLEMPRLRQEYTVASLGLFGSYVRGEQRKGSDLDVLIEFSKVPGMLRFLDLERELSHISALMSGCRLRISTTRLSGTLRRYPSAMAGYSKSSSRV